MFPTVTFDEIKDCICVNAEPLRERAGSERRVSFDVIFQNIQRVYFLQDRCTLTFSKAVSALANHVSHVFGLSSWKKMLRVVTGWIVASMKYLESCGNPVDKYFVGYAAGEHHPSANCDLSLSRIARTVRPLKAIIRIAVFPYRVNEELEVRKMMGMHLASSDGVICWASPFAAVGPSHCKAGS